MKMFKLKNYAYFIFCLFLLTPLIAKAVETWNEATPASTESPTLGDDRIREFKTAMRERLAVDHDFEASESPAFGASGSTIGFHEGLRLKEQSSSPTTITNMAGFWAADDGAGNTELFMRGYSNATAYQLTEGNCQYLRKEVVEVLKDLTATYTEINQIAGVIVGGTASGDIVTNAGTQTLTNKTLTSPSISSPTITGNTSISGNATIGGNGSIGGNGTITGTLDIGSGTTKRVAPAGTFSNASNGAPAISSTSFDVASNVTESSWESVGPTGSSANNIWTAMDGIPSDADWIEIRASNQGMDGSASTNTSLAVYARKNGGTADSGQTYISGVKAYNDSSGQSFCGNVTAGIKIPIDSSRRFQVTWTSTFTSSSILLYVTGWGFNP